MRYHKILFAVVIPLFLIMTAAAQAGWLDKLKDAGKVIEDTARDLSNKAGEALQQDPPPAEPATKEAVAPPSKPVAPAPPAETTTQPVETAKTVKTAAATEKPVQEYGPVDTAQLSPESAKIYEQCVRDANIRSLHYSCNCIAENSDAVVMNIRAERIRGAEEQQQHWLAFIKNAEEDTSLNAQGREARAQYGERKLKVVTDFHDRLEDRSNWDREMHRLMVQSAELEIYNMSLCKRPGGIREKQYESCRTSFKTHPVKGATEEEYCQCVGAKAAEFWMDSDGPASSKRFVPAATKARRACRP